VLIGYFNSDIGALKPNVTRYITVTPILETTQKLPELQISDNDQLTIDKV